LFAQRRKHLSDVNGSRTRFVLVEQCIIGDFFISDRRRFLPLELHDAFEQRLKLRKIIGLPRLCPDLLAQYTQAGELFHERLRKLGLAIVIAFQIYNVRAGLAVRIGGQRTIDQLGQPVADFRRGLALVDQAGQIAHLFGAIFAAGGRQLRALVPAKQRLHGFEQAYFSRVTAKPIVSGPK
jgi:hypothetical protein